MIKRTLMLAFSLLIILLYNAAIAAELTTYTYKTNSDDIYETEDGTIFKKIGYGYVGYIVYHEEIIFLEGNMVCMNGQRFKYKLYEVGPKYHYSINTYRGAEAYRKFIEICGE